MPYNLRWDQRIIAAAEELAMELPLLRKDYCLLFDPRQKDSMLQPLQMGFKSQ